MKNKRESSDGFRGTPKFPTTFEPLWKQLHAAKGERFARLDSLLARVSPRQKPLFATFIPEFLRKPVALSEVFGMGAKPGEPWNLSAEQRADWPQVKWVFERWLTENPFYYRNLPRLPDSKGSERDFPLWMRQEVQKMVTDPTELAFLWEILSEKPPLSVRLKRTEDRAKWIARWNNEGASVRPSPLSPWGVVFDDFHKVKLDVPKGQNPYEIQDEGSQLLAYTALWPEQILPLLPQNAPHPKASFGALKKKGTLPSDLPIPKEWKVIIDACAGAGGKTLALADFVKGQKRLFAYDTSPTKLQALRRRAVKAGVQNIQTVALKEGDEISQIKSFDSSADVVLVDAPCSGWGVLRRNPDVKWRQTQDELDRFPALQSRLLELYASLVKPKGRLVYAVCTFRRDETLQVVSQFAKSEFAKQRGFGSIGGGFIGPFPGSSDGFYIHIFERSGA